MGTCSVVVLLIVSGACGLFSVLAQLYMVGFIMDLFVPITVDRSPRWHRPLRLESWPFLNNLMLLLFFFVQHSAMPRGPLKRIISLCVSEDYYRPLYSLVASMCILISYYLWVPMTSIVWDVQLQPWRNAIYCIAALCWLGVSLALLTLDPLGLLGIQDPLYQLLGWEQELKLVKTGLYGWVRHPVYSLLILSIWITPTMTVGHLVLSVMYTVYMLIAVPLYEEPDLLNQFGPEYAEYMKTTPCFIPKIPFLAKAKTV